MKGFVSVRVAVFFENFGPYHVARLNAASQACEVLGLEWRGRSKTYAWEPVGSAMRFEKRTLLGSEITRCSNRDLLRLLENELDPASLDAVAVNGWGDFGSLAVISWALKCGIPIVIMSESTAWDETRVVWKEWVKRRIVGLGTAALVGGTPHKDYIVQLGMPAERIFLGYDAVDNAYFAAGAAKWRKQPGEVERQTLHGPRKSEVRKKYGLPENYFLASARFVEKKNLPRLLQAYARYRELAQNSEFRSQKSEFQVSGFSVSTFTPWSLVLLGDGDLRSSLESQVSGLGLHEHVQMPGFKQYPDLPAYYGLANAFIHASTTEQWGLVVNEAMASGLPVLVSNRCGCAQDLVQEGVNGFTFDPYNVEQLAQLMLKLSTLDPEKGRGPHGALRPQLSAFGSESHRIISQWGPERFARGLHDAAETALKSPASNASLMDRLILRLLMAR
jgi:glycosyltransferase involved in cell wall biosynthesis